MSNTTYQLKLAQRKAKRYMYLLETFTDYQDALNSAISLTKEYSVNGSDCYYPVVYDESKPIGVWLDRVNELPIVNKSSKETKPMNEKNYATASDRKAVNDKPFASIHYEIKWSDIAECYIIKWEIKYTKEYRSQEEHKLYFHRMILDEDSISRNYEISLYNSFLGDKDTKEFNIVERSAYLDFNLAKEAVKVSAEGYAATFREIRKQNEDKQRKQNYFSSTRMIYD